MYKKIIGLFALLLVAQPAEALTKKQVFNRAVFVGALAGFAAYRMNIPASIGKWVFPCEIGETDENVWVHGGPDFQSLNGKPELKGATGAGLAVFAGTSGLFGWIFSHWTAKSRYKWVEKQFESLESKPLFSVHMTDASIATILQDSGCESTELPLVTAFLCLKSCDATLVKIEENLLQAIEDAGRHSPLGRKLRKRLKRVTYDLNRVRANEQFVKNHDKIVWLEQWKIHQKRELAREQMHQQLAMVHMQPELHGHVVYHWR